MFHTLICRFQTIQRRQAKKSLKTLTITLLLAILLSTTVLGISSNKAHAQIASSTLSIQSVYVTDGSNNAKSSFQSGNGIQYHINAINSSTQTLNVSVMFFASTIIQAGNKQQEFIIIDKTYTVNMPPGPSRFYTPSAIPAGATSAPYKLEGTIVLNSNRTVNAQGSSNPFTVTHVAASPLNVPYFSQFDDSNNSTRNDECGETAVAMAAAYYADLYDSPNDWITAVRNQIGVGPNGLTDVNQLKSALWGLPGRQGLQGEQINVTPLGTSFASVVQQIQTATQNGYPVIALINATKLIPSRTYSGHWIVIRGIIGQTVYINDPDSSKTGTREHNPTQLSLSVYQAAVMSDALKGYGQTDGLIVTGEDFQSA